MAKISHLPYLHTLQYFPENFHRQKHWGRALTVSVFSVVSCWEFEIYSDPLMPHFSKTTGGPQQKGSHSSCTCSLCSSMLSTPVQNYGASCETFRRRTWQQVPDCWQASIYVDTSWTDCISRQGGWEMEQKFSCPSANRQKKDEESLTKSRFFCSSFNVKTSKEPLAHSYWLLLKL